MSITHGKGKMDNIIKMCHSYTSNARI